MPPFRVVARHPDADHHDHAWAQVAGPFDYEDEAREAAATSATLDVAPASLDPDEPVRPDPAQPLNEAAALGYELKAQELVPVDTEADDAGNETVVKSRWKDLR